jgi:hypothetical protein
VNEENEETVTLTAETTHMLKLQKKKNPHSTINFTPTPIRNNPFCRIGQNFTTAPFCRNKSNNPYVGTIY